MVPDGFFRTIAQPCIAPPKPALITLATLPDHARPPDTHSLPHTSRLGIPDDLVITPDANSNSQNSYFRPPHNPYKRARICSQTYSSRGSITHTPHTQSHSSPHPLFPLQHHILPSRVRGRPLTRPPPSAHLKSPPHSRANRITPTTSLTIYITPLRNHNPCYLLHLTHLLWSLTLV